MFKTLVRLALASAVFTGPALAQGPETEFGVDVGIKWLKAPGGGDGVLQIQTPVDVRVAFLTSGHTAVEPRFTAQYVSVGGTSVYAFDPGLNFLVAAPGSVYNNGGYFTLGVDLAIAGGKGMTGSAVYSVNAGFGLRRPMGKAAARTELFLGYTPKQGTNVLQGFFTVGGRIGFSFFN